MSFGVEPPLGEIEKCFVKFKMNLLVLAKKMKVSKVGFVFALLGEEGQVCPPRPGAGPGWEAGGGAHTVSAVGPAEFVVQLL